jgi:ankyrin repeat protein
LGSAVQNNQAEEVALLLARGADPNGPNYWPTLHLAVENDNMGIVKALFAAGAKIDKQDRTHTPLYYTSDVTLLRLLVDHGAGIEGHGYNSNEDYTALMQSAGNNALPAVQFLLSHGADPNKHTDRGTTALMLAAQKANANVVRYLLDHGAEIHARNDGGQSALGFSFQNQYPGVTALLESRGHRK